MTTKKRIISNTFYSFSGFAAEYIFAYFIIIAIARYLGDVGMGEYSFIFAMAHSLVFLTHQGMDYLMIRDISREEDKAQVYVSNVLSMKLILTICAFVIMSMIALSLPKSPEVINALILALFSCGVAAFLEVYDPYLQAKQRISIISLAKVLERGTALLLVIIFLLQGKGIIWVVAAVFIGRLIRDLIMISASWRHIGFKFGFDIDIWKDLFIKGLPFLATNVFLYIYFRVDIVMLSFMKGDAVTGWYSAAYKLIDLISFIPYLVISATLPGMAASFKKDDILMQDIFRRTLRYLIILAFPITIGGFIIAPKAIDFLYGFRYGFENSAIAMQVLIWCEIFLFANYLFGNVLNIIGKQYYFTIIGGGAVILNIILNLLLIPRYSFVGAGIATVISEIAIFVILLYFARRFLGNIDFFSMAWKPIIASVIMGIILYFLQFSLGILLLIPVGIVTYAIVFLLINGLNKHDKEILLFFKQEILKLTSSSSRMNQLF
ncbi:MAG: flippase [Deltaproteobacteria bacterium]|nr:flippase [Deltaproteobacteria bacterium]